MASEWRKITTTKMWWLLALVMFGYMAFLGAVLGFSLTQSTEPTGPGMGGGGVPSGLEAAQATYTVGASLGYVFPLIVGALAMTGEFRHQTITPTLLYQPVRSTVLFAKLAVNLGLGLVYGVIGTLGAVIGAAPLLGTVGDGLYLDNGEVWGNLIFSVVSLAIWAVIGVGLGTMLTNQVAAIVIILAFTQFVEPILRIGLAAGGDALDLGAMSESAKFLPGAAAEALVGSSFYAASGLELLGRWAGAAVLIAYAVVFAVIGRFTTLRKDIT
ncbi:ABC-type transport system involved in multi-copper enzyme maturation permease subunit [Nocardioides daedukensis]|uniref:ABC-type transport system involved in multi-copper enzyme maturation permease subunit n=2 Tax=Nocardioides daedukensis TaxID=634462 RepID=A0A7Y9US70_9ACTN|nr:ABC-type transport system involved in multi-copper enzyme maturation permease subunit [Nocardioides daedukensis]